MPCIAVVELDRHCIVSVHLGKCTHHPLGENEERIDHQGFSYNLVLAMPRLPFQHGLQAFQRQLVRDRQSLLVDHNNVHNLVGIERGLLLTTTSRSFFFTGQD
jgi:hypothetical protein